MSNNYVVCSLCGAKIRMGGPGGSKLEKYGYRSPLFDINQYFCGNCTKKLSKYVWKESVKALKKKRRQARRERLWRNLKNSTHHKA